MMVYLCCYYFVMHVYDEYVYYTSVHWMCVVFLRNFKYCMIVCRSNQYSLIEKCFYMIFFFHSFVHSSHSHYFLFCLLVFNGIDVLNSYISYEEDTHLLIHLLFDLWLCWWWWWVLLHIFTIIQFFFFFFPCFRSLL